MSTNLICGGLKKMQASLNGGEVQYQLPIGDTLVDLNPYLGKNITLNYTGKIHCIACGRKTNKSFNQGHCYPCFKKLASCDICIVSPEKCHFDQGTCREPEWAQSFCMSDHIVYLANSSGLKVGITRINQIPTRWIDQGATQAISVFRVKTRKQSGLIEDCLKQFIADKTNWRALLKGDAEPQDLVAVRDNLMSQAKAVLDPVIESIGIESVYFIDDAEITNIQFPVNQYLEKITSFNLDKKPEVQGNLMGIKGQYLILDTGVINIRKFTAYEVAFSD